MRRQAPALLKSYPRQTRWAQFCNSARWTANLRPDHPPGPSDPGPFTVPIAETSQIKLPFRFDIGISLFAKRTPRPFPPPFLSPPSGSFSDPLSTHRQVFVNGEQIKGFTNGDDAAYASDSFIAVNDGVGAWSTRPRGHAGLWSRLILHFWVVELQRDLNQHYDCKTHNFQPSPLAYLQRAYEQTISATSEPNLWHGTTTATGAQLFYKKEEQEGLTEFVPLVYATNLGDSKVLVLRPRNAEVIYRSTEQWHWFDCPRQLGTNSPDTPSDSAVVDVVEIERGDLVIAMSDGVIDNLWEHEIIENVLSSYKAWNGPGKNGPKTAMQFVAEQLVAAAKVIALDPFAESPFMEHAIEEGLPSHGGKLDDISVVAAICEENK